MAMRPAALKSVMLQCMQRKKGWRAVSIEDLPEIQQVNTIRYRLCPSAGKISPCSTTRASAGALQTIALFANDLDWQTMTFTAKEYQTRSMNTLRL